MVIKAVTSFGKPLTPFRRPSFRVSLDSPINTTELYQLIRPPFRRKVLVLTFAFILRPIRPALSPPPVTSSQFRTLKIPLSGLARLSYTTLRIPFLPKLRLRSPLIVRPPITSFYMWFLTSLRLFSSPSPPLSIGQSGPIALSRMGPCFSFS